MFSYHRNFICSTSHSFIIFLLKIFSLSLWKPNGNKQKHHLPVTSTQTICRCMVTNIYFSNNNELVPCRTALSRTKQEYTNLFLVLCLFYKRTSFLHIRDQERSFSSIQFVSGHNRSFHQNKIVETIISVHTRYKKWKLDGSWKDLNLY